MSYDPNAGYRALQGASPRRPTLLLALTLLPPLGRVNANTETLLKRFENIAMLAPVPLHLLSPFIPSLT